MCYLVLLEILFQFFLQIYIINEKMRENFYPKSEEILFTNREIELETLDFYLEEILNGLKENV